MKKENAIALAAAHAEFNKAEKYYVTNDEKVFTEASSAIAAAIRLSAGNPEVAEILASEFGGTCVTKTKAELVEAAKEKVLSLEAQVTAKQLAFDTVDPKKKEAATIALNKVKEALEKANKVLADAEALAE